MVLRSRLPPWYQTFAARADGRIHSGPSGSADPHAAVAVLGIESRPVACPAPVVFGHFLIAVVGLVLSVVYLVADIDALAWISLTLLMVLALTGFGMVARWLPTRTHDGQNPPPEKSFPLAVVGAHGLLAVATLVTVLLTAVGVGS